jgi:CBS domain-containing protein
MGRQSFSADQRLERLPEVEPLTRLPVREIMTPNPDTIDAACTIEDAIVVMGRQNRRWMPVTDANSYVGLVAVADLAAAPREAWSSREVRDTLRLDALPASPDDPVSEVARRLRTSGADAVAVTSAGTVVGVVTLRDLTNVEVLLDRLTNPTGQ